MTYTVRIRGAGGNRMADYMCPEHGIFDALVARDPMPDDQPCPTCGATSPWSIGAPLYKPQRGAVSQGKVQKSERATWTDTSDLGDGMPLGEWKKKRAKVWEAERHKRVKEMTK